MGRIEQYDHKRRKRLIIFFPISVIALLIILSSIERTRVIDRIFMVGYEGPTQLIPEIKIIDEREIESDVSTVERHAMIVQNVLLDTDEMEISDNPNGITSKAAEETRKDHIPWDDAGKHNLRSYPSYADVPYREDYVILKMVEPEYPLDALLEGLEGFVLVEAYINEHGKVAGSWVRSSYGPESFETASLDAVQQFLFKPTKEKGKPVPFWVSFLIRFEFRHR